jgi:hypothetical protein
MPVAGFVPSRLLGPQRLTATPDAREIALGGSDTTKDRLSAFRFDAQAYASELARATARADRMWPARSVAETLTAMSRQDRDATTSGTRPGSGGWVASWCTDGVGMIELRPASGT